MDGNDNVTKVLIAHITEDRAVAEKLKDQLLLYGASRLECLLWEESRQNRLQELKKRIEDTDLLLLLVASGIVDDGDWGWLQWATAMSWSMGNGHVSRILLHNRSLTPPKCIQVAIEHSFNSEVDRIKEFLKYFLGSIEFTKDKNELNKNFNQQNIQQYIQQLDGLSRDIGSLFQEPLPPPRVKQATFPKAITLTVDNPRSLTRENLSQNIRIQSQTPGAMEIFGLDDAPLFQQDGSWSWQDIVNDLPPNNSQGWIEELADSIYSAHCGRVPKVVQSTFRANGKLFKPILYGKNWTDNSEQFTVLFVEQISEGWVDNAPTVNLATLLTASILGARLQWAICAKYLPQLDDWQKNGVEAIRKNLREIKFSFDNIEEDAKIRGQVEAPGQRNIDRLRDSFASENERQTIANNMSEQEPHKQTLRDADTQDNVDEVRVALTELARLNKIVTAMVASRYSQLLNENTL